ncbi:MAG TPA: hypothetical protein VFH17_05245 [Coriobacteriia bacterium]|nr:hypothetical protein [Coriobacteriia bacterium]
MPQEKRKIPGPEGKPVDATAIGFQVGGEHWNEYLLDDGTVLRMKPVMAEILRVDNVYDGEGNPVYVTRTQNVIVVNAPEKIRKKQGS